MTLRSVGILGGTGRQGRGLAQRLARAGYRVVVGSRDVNRAAEAVRGWAATPAPITAATYADTAAGTDIVVLTVPFETVAATLDQLRSTVKATFVIDVTVPLVFDGGQVRMLEVAEGSAAEHVRAHTPANIGVAAAFKTVPAHVLDAVDTPLDCDEFVCGDSAESRAVAAELVTAIQGLRAVDAGPLSRARSIEYMTLLAIAINRRHKVHDARFRIVGL
jgi:NADPH-dependent F420 reductase